MVEHLDEASSCAVSSSWDERTLIVAVVGPTASGKSQLAIDLAQVLPADLGGRGAQIVSADALQLYRGMDIGTAKTPVHERAGITHHQIDVLNVWDEASVARYQKDARADVESIQREGDIAIVAGGSGLYQRALLDRIDFPGTDPQIRARLEEEAHGSLGGRGLHERLSRLDPLSAERIDPHNVRRIVRALEVIELTGRPYSATMPDHSFIRPALMIAPKWDQDALDQRINQRTRLMFDQGLVEETRGLIDLGLREARTASRATGYAQALAVIDGEMTREEAIESVALATRQLARRQIKWLRPDPRVIYLDCTGEEGEAQRLVERARQHITEAAERYRTHAKDNLKGEEPWDR